MVAGDFVYQLRANLPGDLSLSIAVQFVWARHRTIMFRWLVTRARWSALVSARVLVTLAVLLGTDRWAAWSVLGKAPQRRISHRSSFRKRSLFVSSVLPRRPCRYVPNNVILTSCFYNNILVVSIYHLICWVKLLLVHIVNEQFFYFYVVHLTDEQ